jgi:excisionase family DNA binding protein
MSYSMDASNEVVAPLLTITEAATFLNVSKATIRRWTNEGRLQCSRIGARAERRFRKTDLIAFVNPPEPSTGVPGAQRTESPPANCATPSHCCVISKDTDEEWATLGPQILENLDRGAHVLVIEDPIREKRLEGLLRQRGLNKRELLATHALRCVSIEESYFLSGTMQWDRAVAYVESAILGAKARGFARILVIGACSWADDFAGQDIEGELKKYELGLDAMLSRHPDASVLCPYTATQVSAQMIVQAFSTHPVMQIHSTLMPGLLRQSAT